MALKISWEPASTGEGEGQPLEELATASLLRMEVEEAGGLTLTHLEDLKTRSTRDHVNAPAIFLAERLVAIWGNALYGWRSPPSADAPRVAQYRWRRAHALELTGGGVPLPKVELHRESEDGLRVRARADAPNAPGLVRFLCPCDEVVPLHATRERLREFVESVLARLEERCPASLRVERLRGLWRDATVPGTQGHRAYRRLSALGALPGAEDEGLTQALLALPGPDVLVEAALTLADPSDWRAPTLPALRMAEELADAPQDPQADLRLRLRDRVAEPGQALWGEPAWQVGWRQARALRAALRELSSTPMPRTLDLQGVEEPSLSERSSWVAWRKDGSARRLCGRRSSRFHTLRDLHPVLFSPQRSGAVAFAPHLKGRASVANAFAAEWMAPRDRIQEALGGRRELDADDLSGLAKQLDAPLSVVRHQIENHVLARLNLDQEL